MATDKKKKEVKVRDLKPSKDAKGGGGRSRTPAEDCMVVPPLGPKTQWSGHSLRLLRHDKPPSGPIPPGGPTYR